jgi:hypothetical protein
MEEAPDNGKESLHSAHANGMNECHHKATVHYQTELHYVALSVCSYKGPSPFSATCPSSFLASSVGAVSFS